MDRLIWCKLIKSTSIQKFLETRFVADSTLLQRIEPFVHFDATTDIEAVAPDLSLASLATQFEDISNNPDIWSNSSLSEIILKLSKTAESRQNFREVITLLARIAACTPLMSNHALVLSTFWKLNYGPVKNWRQKINICLSTTICQTWHRGIQLLRLVCLSQRNNVESAILQQQLGLNLDHNPISKVFPKARNLVDSDNETSNDEEGASSTFFEFWINTL